MPRSTITWLTPAVMGLVALGAMGCGDDGGAPEVLECEPDGSCSCDLETRTCSCVGGSNCVIVSENDDDINFNCDGNAACSLECGANCDVTCPGTTGCDVVMGEGSTAECNGTADCDYTCLGDCQVDCSGTTRCTVRCPEGASCNITSCQGPQLTECPDQNAQACRTECPPPLAQDAG